MSSVVVLSNLRTASNFFAGPVLNFEHLVLTPPHLFISSLTCFRKLERYVSWFFANLSLFYLVVSSLSCHNCLRFALSFDS